MNTKQPTAIEMVQENGMALESMPEMYRCWEICIAAVMQNREALQFVPEKIRHDIGIWVDLNTTGMALQRV